VNQGEIWWADLGDPVGSAPGLWLGPSTFFSGLDTNEDGALSRSEWQAHYGQHRHAPGEICMGEDFDKADCDDDELLTWSEYYAYRMARQSKEHPDCVTAVSSQRPPAP